jgi:hypothetical protein
MVSVSVTFNICLGALLQSCLKPVLASHGEKALFRSVLPPPEDPCQKILKKIGEILRLHL